MNIKKILVYQVDLPFVEGRYAWANGKFVETFDFTIVEVETHDVLCGLGEVCALESFYHPAFGAGARTGIGEPAQHREVSLKANCQTLKYGLVNIDS